MDDLDHGDFLNEQPLLGLCPEISLLQDRSGLADDDDRQTQAPNLPRFSGLKRKFVECDGDLDVARDVSPSKRTCLEERGYHIPNSDLILWPNSGCIIASCPAPDVSVPATLPSVNTSMSQYDSPGDVSLNNQSPSSSLQCYEIELSLPESSSMSPAASLRTPLPNYSAPDVRLQSAGSSAPFGPCIDNTPDSSSDSGLTSDDSSCGSWAYLETLEPDSPTGTFVTLEYGLCKIPNLDIPDPDVDIDLTRHPQPECSQLSYRSSGTISDKYKRKRLFIANEDEYEERPCKRRSIEQ